MYFLRRHFILYRSNKFFFLKQKGTPTRCALSFLERSIILQQIPVPNFLVLSFVLLRIALLLLGLRLLVLQTHRGR